MIIDIKVPRPGESVSEVEIAAWLVNDGDIVSKDQEIAEIESEKATLPLIASEAGQVRILKPAGESVPVGAVVCTIDTAKSRLPSSSKKIAEEKNRVIPSRADVAQTETTSEETEKKATIPPPEVPGIKVTPLARRMMDSYGLSVDEVVEGLRKISTRDINRLTQSDVKQQIQTVAPESVSRDETRTKMSMLRRKLSQRLVAVKNETAMLTTFNEADMSRIMALRKNYQDRFVQKHGVKLGFMSLFTKASAVALKLFPQVNSRIEGDEIVTPGYCDIGIAVQTDKGLMVPVIRNAEVLSLVAIEREIAALAEKARSNRIGIEEMQGGTFTITNGGIFGSLMSTPLLNPPQAAILGMHAIKERPVAIEGRAEVRPMMYLALSYDHRIIDGKDSVGFLVMIKELIEDPVKLLFGGDEPEKILLGI